MYPCCNMPLTIKNTLKNQCIQNPKYKRIFWELLTEGVLIFDAYFISNKFIALQ